MNRCMHIRRHTRRNAIILVWWRSVHSARSRWRDEHVGSANELQLEGIELRARPGRRSTSRFRHFRSLFPVIASRSNCDLGERQKRQRHPAHPSKFRTFRLHPSHFATYVHLHVHRCFSLISPVLRFIDNCLSASVTSVEVSTSAHTYPLEYVCFPVNHVCCV